MKNLITLFLLLFLSAELNSQEKSVVRISNPTPEQFKNFFTQDYDIAAYSPGLFLDVVLTDDEYNLLSSQGYKLTITQTEKQLQENLKATTDLAGYRSYTDLLTELQNIQAAHPTICKLYDIGDSRGKQYSAPAYNDYKHDIWAMKISDNVVTEEDEPCIFYMGNHHAREPISLEVAMYVLNHIVNNYGTDPDITASVNNKQIWFVPLVNPNGHKIVWDNVDTWWRKNIRDNNNSNTINTGTIDGVDLNRNYSWEWGGQGTSSDPTDLTYCGPSPTSEPEIVAMKNMLDTHHFVAGITYHSYSELVLFPYGYETAAFAPDHNSLEALAISMANTIPASGGGYYTPDKSSGLYPASGITDDYAYGQHGIFSFTIELGTTFIPPQGDILGICTGNLQAAKILLNRVNQSTLTGLVKDANTLLPVVAEVYITGIDNTGAFREPYESDASFGRYYRLLQNGNYTVTFSAYGYIPQTFNNVNINSTGQTILNVNLVPAQSVVVTGVVTDLATGLPIQGATIEVMNTPVPTVTTNVAGEYTIPSIMEGSYDFLLYAAGYITIIEGVSVVNNSVIDLTLEEITTWCFETGAFEDPWSFGGNLPWAITSTGAYEGLYCSKSGGITHNQTSIMEITFYPQSNGVISFFRKVSSESGWDFLKFFIDGVLQNSWSGEQNWAEVTFPVTSGNHKFKWIYSKDSNTSTGSDCAWLDCVQFFGFPEIEITPISYTVLLPPNESIIKQLQISNLGEANLNFTATVEYLADNKALATVYPLNAAYNTGTTTTSSKTYNSLVRAYPTAENGWMKFDVSSIPDGSTINSVEFHGYINANNYPWWSITPVTNDPVTTASSILYADINAEGTTGYYLFRNESSTLTNGWITYMLGGNVNTNLAAALTQNWFAIGIMDRDNGTYYIGFDGWNQANKPYLVIDYTYVPPYTWLKVNGLTSTTGTVTGGNNQNITVSFNSTGLALGTYNANIKIASNDADEPLITVPCALNVINLLSLDLTVLLEGPFNGTTMNTTLNSSGLIPNNQPYNTTPWNYSGTESVTTMPNANVVDWVLVELRDATDAASATAATRVARMAGFLLKDGSIVGLDGTSNLQFNNSMNQQLFVVIYHRNHLGIISANGLSQVGGVYSCNFTTGAGQAYGGSSAQNEISTGVWGLISGDNNADGNVNSNDKTADWDLHAGKSGLQSADLNLDGQVDNRDKDDKWLPNFGKVSYIPL